MSWPLDKSTPLRSVTDSMEPTLSSQIAGRQFQIPFDGIRLEKILLNGIYWAELAATIPLRGVGKIPVNHMQVRKKRACGEYSVHG
jgi:hypothetical protein